MNDNYYKNKYFKYKQKYLSIKQEKMKGAGLFGIDGEVYIYYNHEDAMKSIDTLKGKISPNVEILIKNDRDVCNEQLINKSKQYGEGEDSDIPWKDLTIVFKNSLNNIIIRDNTGEINSFLPSDIILSIFAQIKFFLGY